MSTELEKQMALIDDVDLRLEEAYRTLLASTGTDEELVALRLAYVRGYLDALEEVANGNGAELCKRHGYRNPLRHVTVKVKPEVESAT